MSDAQWDGVPRDPERDGWHWIAFREDHKIAFCKHWYRRVWIATSGHPRAEASLVCLSYDYLGPCHTPAEVSALTDAAWQAGWAAGREAAAQCTEAWPFRHPAAVHGRVNTDDVEAAEGIVDAIRALPVPPPQHGEPAP